MLCDLLCEALTLESQSITSAPCAHDARQYEKSYKITLYEWNGVEWMRWCCQGGALVRRLRMWFSIYICVRIVEYKCGVLCCIC